MRYRVKWVQIERHEGFIDDGDQDGDAWEGTKKEAQTLVREMRERKANDGTAPGYTYKIVPAL